MSEYVLVHHGVKGMKWGVRKAKKDTRKEYKKDVKRLRNLTKDAANSSDWSRAYRSAAKMDDKRLKAKEHSDMKKHGQLSDKTKEAQKINKQLHADKLLMDRITDYKISQAKSFTEQMAKKYGDKKINYIKTHMKDGQEYVKKIIKSDPAAYTVEKRPYIDSNGNKRYSYQRVRTTYYYI